VCERAAGRVVNVGSVAGRFAVPGPRAYSASKFALRALTEVADYELRPFGVRAILVEPPFVDTPLAAGLDPAGEFPDSAYERLYARFARFAHEQYESALAPSDVAEPTATGRRSRRRPRGASTEPGRRSLPSYAPPSSSASAASSASSCTCSLPPAVIR
jgi:NAD(P)-dependent dehydrogenase (short-subunit alcohol dehydrogenase family)